MTSVPARDTQPPVSPWLLRLPVLFITGLVLLVLLLIIGVGAVQLRYRDQIVPGVSALGVPLGGMTPAAARSALEDRFTYDEDAVFTFRWGDQFRQFTAGELGVVFDVEATVAEAFAAAHSGNVVVDVIDMGLIWLNGQDVAPLIRYDQNVAVTRLTEIAATLNRPPEDAQLVINGTEVSAVPGRVGQTVDVLATLNRLNDTIVTLGTGAEVELVIDETPPRVWDAQAAAQKAQAALSGPLLLVAEGDMPGSTIGPWQASVEQIARLLDVYLVDNGDGTQSYDVGLNMEAFGSTLETLAPGLVRPASDARFTFNEDTGQLEMIEPGVNGRALDIAETLTRMENAVFDTGSRVVAMAFEYTLPRYHEGQTAQELGIVGLLSEATTYYNGSTEPRRRNIAAAASRFNGVIIGPGEEFSFNEWVGDISPEEGFVEGLVIAGGRTIKGVGGGVCQVSTTAFRAAFYAGFPILERYAHGYRVAYYEDAEGPGLDAAIYVPDLDFRFLNDTDGHLLIETSVFPGNNAIQFRFYGTPDGRQVIKQGPDIRSVVPPEATTYEVNPDLAPGQSLQVDWAAEGADVMVRRIILDANGQQIREDSFFSHYLPWGAIVQVPPGDPRAGTTG